MGGHVEAEAGRQGPLPPPIQTQWNTRALRFRTVGGMAFKTQKHRSQLMPRAPLVRTRQGRTDSHRWGLRLVPHTPRWRMERWERERRLARRHRDRICLWLWQNDWERTIWARSLYYIARSGDVHHLSLVSGELQISTTADPRTMRGWGTPPPCSQKPTKNSDSSKMYNY